MIVDNSRRKKATTPNPLCKGDGEILVFENLDAKPNRMNCTLYTRKQMNVQ